MNIRFIKYRKIYYFFSGFLIIGSLVSLFLFGLKFGIDFKGGSLLEVDFRERPTNDAIKNKISDLNLGEIVFQPTQERGMILRFREVDEDTHQKLLKKLGELSKVEEKRFETIGPTIGKELTRKTKISIILATFAISFYIALAFRKVRRPISSFKYSACSLIALLHDLIIPVGVFSLLGKFYNIEITIPFVAAILTVLGYSINDTIVVFDRIRENLLRSQKNQSFEEIVDNSINQTLGRSVNTVLTTLFALLAIFFFGGESLKYFSLALIIGISSGCYSSIFIASPLLVTWQKIAKRRT